MQPIKLRGIFLNPPKANCSIYESGRMIYECLLLSDKYELDYMELTKDNLSISGAYDFYVFNYHHQTMSWLDTLSVRRLPGPKITFILETLPNNPFVLCPPDDFDAYCALDPTMRVADKRVYAFPRPLEVSTKPTPYHASSVPVIGSFGFATPGKGFELVVEAVNREFDEALVRINIPHGTYADDAFWGLHKQNYADYLTELCKRTAKKGVEVIFTRDYMSKEELIEWCAKNTLNCFLYNRNQPGLAATTDQAIASGRPLAISDNDTFRHIAQYINPYPRRSLKESIAFSQEEIIQIQKDWSPVNFAKKFEQVLNDLGLFAGNSSRQLNSKISVEKISMLKVEKRVRGETMFTWLRSKLRIRTRLREAFGLSQPPSQINNQSGPKLVRPSFSGKAKENTVLIVTHGRRQCGIHQYGLNIFEALKKSARYSFAYAECSSVEDLKNAAINTNPSLIIYNYYPATMPWLNPDVTSFFKATQMGIMHEVTQQEADSASSELFDYHLCPDPTLIENNPLVFKTKRMIPTYINVTDIPKEVTIGSFGFGFDDKGFERLVAQVQNEFEQATIKIRMPFNDIVDPGGESYAIATAKRCRDLIWKPGIKLEINHGFLSNSELLDFLAGNSINVFFYEVCKHRGISSVIDYALAVQRPIAITKCGMFRHISSARPSICIEDSSLKEIMGNGVVPLIPFYNEWSEAAFVMDYEKILDRVLGKDHSEIENGNTGYNRILDNVARKQYKQIIDTLFELVPDKLNKKIYEANIQQAFVMDTVRIFAKKDSKILCVGSFEDTAAEALKKLGFIMDEIDPAINYDLDAFCRLPTTRKGSYDIIFSTSVLEHVPDDGLFVNQIADLLTSNGIAVLTCDFKDDYVQGDPLPATDLRFYTEKDLKERILPRLVDCQLVDEPYWQNAKHDFLYAGYFKYAFASLVFRKN